MRHQLLYLGITHQTAPVWVRERLKPDGDQLRVVLRNLASLAIESAVLSTCGRFEVYAVAPRSHRNDWLVRATGVITEAPAALRPNIRVLAGRACARHLLCVAAGLESPIIGEPHILGQVREAFQLANEVGSIGPVLSALFRAAIHCGRRVRHQANVNPTRESSARLAVRRIERACDRRPPGTVAIVGSGRIASEVAAELAARHIFRMVIVSRSPRRAHQLARRVGGSVASMDRLPALLARAGAAVVCTSSTGYVVDRSVFRRRRGPDITVIDMSVPRNVDPSVARMAGVHLVHLDQLSADRRASDAGIAHAERIVDEQLARFCRWRRARVVAPLIRALLHLTAAGDPADPRGRKRALHLPIVKLVENVAA